MKKLYPLFVFVIILSSSQMLRSQIQYYDINPDKSMFIPNSFDVDMFKDALPFDFGIHADYSDTGAETGYKVEIIPFTQLNEVMVVNDSLVRALNPGDPIDASQSTWTNNSQKWMTLINSGTSTVGHWNNVSFRFLGVRMYKNGDYFYGWIQMTITPGTQPTILIYDMAYQKTPGKGIEAGQTIGIRDDNPGLARYLLTNRQLQIQTIKPVHVSISDISGQLLTGTDVKTISSIDLSSYPNGIYLLNISGEKGSITEKIVLR